MSLRNIRKIYGETQLPKPEASSDEEYEPLYTRNSAKPRFSNLLLNSHSESGEESSEQLQSEEFEEVQVEKTKKKKKKGRKNKKCKGRVPSKVDGVELDDIDKSVMEVNAILGAPPPAPMEPEIKIDIVKELFGLNFRFLNVAFELKKMYGPDVDDEVKRRGRVPNLRRCQRPVIIPTESVFPRSAGSSMSLLLRENDRSYFVFDHGKEYQRRHQIFLLLTDRRLYNTAFTPIDDSYMHVEERLEMADYLFKREEYSTANSLIEQMLAHMQSVFHPSFNLCDTKTRLEYKYIENRAFHIAMLKYIHLLTNRACHRTALELAKMLLNLDPSDPLAILFIIDTLALRAGEYHWLVLAIKYWSQERDAKYMFNIQYSYALASYYMAVNNNTITKEAATMLLQKAILRFPVVAVELLEAAKGIDHPELSSHPLFRPQAEKPMVKGMKELIHLYATFTATKWRLSTVMEWLSTTMVEMASLYDSKVEIQEEVKRLAMQNYSLFRQIPDQIQRHLCIIKPMTDLLVDGAVPDVPITRSSDPIPPIDTVDRHGYARLSVNYTTLQRFLGSSRPGAPDMDRYLESEENRRPVSLGEVITTFFTSFRVGNVDQNGAGDAQEDTDDDLSD